MIKVIMTDDVRKYEIKTAGPFTTRQIICIALGFAYSIPIAMFVPMSWDNKILLIAVLAMPVIIAGFIKMDGAKFEVLLLRILYLKILTPARRKYKSSNSFKEAMKSMEARLERKKLSKMDPKKRLEYQKSKVQKNVTYSTKLKYKVYR